jgi:hypothetical protein
VQPGPRTPRINRPMINPAFLRGEEGRTIEP